MIVFYDESILSYVASIRDYFGLSSNYLKNDKLSKLISIRKPSKVFLLLVDGMGANLIEKKLSKDSFLRRNMFCKTTTVFPPTTTAATTSIRTGKAPNENAWLGWMQDIKEVNDIVVPFFGKGFYNDKNYGQDLMYKIAPVTFIEDELNNKKIKARSLFPSFMEDGCDDFQTMCNRLISYSNNDDYSFIYAYWDKYDTYMHENGPSSKVCDDYLLFINNEIERLANNLSNDTMLIITADHGQIDVKSEYNLYESKFDKYLKRLPSIEPRAMTFFIKDGMQKEFEKEFKDEFEESFILLSHQQVLDTKLFGNKENNIRFEEFIGDYIAIAKSNIVLAYKDHPIPPMKGQHAGMCEDELMIPIIVY